MNFLYPGFLYALAAVAIPIIIHLFNFRLYKTVYFSNVRFLNQVKKDTKAKSQLKHWLVLLLRVLTIAALVLAFAQPYVPLADEASQKRDLQDYVGIYIDNSFSMDAESKYGNVFEIAKNKARKIAEAYKHNTKFLLVTNDFELKHQHLVNREQLIEFINEIEVSPGVKNISDVYSRQYDLLSENKSKSTIFMLSDFQESICDFENIKTDTLLNIHLVPLISQQTNNLYIDSCWFETPYRKINQPEKLFVKIVNNSNEDYHNIPIKLTLNDTLKALGSFNIEEDASRIVELTYTNTQAGVLHGKTEITDYPITYDNTFYFTYTIEENVKILCINQDEKNKHLAALFENDEYFSIDYFDHSNIITSRFGDYHVIILNSLEELSSGLNQELMDFIAKGGVMVFFPSANGDTDTYNQLFGLIRTNQTGQWDTVKTKIQTINRQHEIYGNVFKRIDQNADLPVVFGHYDFSRLTETTDEPVLTAENGDKILSVTPYQKGRAYIFSMPLGDEYSNFVKHPLFVPTLYNMALFSQISTQIYHTIGKDRFVDISADLSDENFRGDGSEYGVFHIISLDGKYDFIPQNSPDISSMNIRLFVRQNIAKAGNYYVTTNHDPITGIAFNYNRNESDLSYVGRDQLAKLMSKYRLSNMSIIDADDNVSFSGTIEEIKKGKKYWKVFIVLALIFLGIEIAILRLWR